jgi:hypothetical protein
MKKNYLVLAIAFLVSSPFAHSAAQMDHPTSQTPAAGISSASTTLHVSGTGLTLATISISDFKSIPHKTVNFHNAHTNTDETYSGVPLTDLLAKYGAPTGKDLHGKALSDYIVATGSDGYKALLALAETDPSFHPGEVIVADTLDGKPLDAKEGPFKLVVTEDKRPARSVHNLVSIELKSAD